MPHTKSAIKRLKTNEERHIRNKAVKSRLRTLKRNFLEAVDGGKADEAKSMLPGLFSEYDKAAKKGVIKENTANRNKKRFTLKLAVQK